MASCLYMLVNDGELILTGDGTSGVYIWGAQLEQAQQLNKLFSNNRHA
jgi:hypothetical protein